MAKQVSPIRATTQEFLELEDVIDNMALLRDGSVALVIQTTAVNFDLLSSKEQEARIITYAGFLNSLSFPIQILIRSERKDISLYLNILKKQEEAQKDPMLSARIKAYREFVALTVKERNVLDKKFYIIIPFSSLELGTAHVKTLAKKKRLPYPKSYILEKAKNALLPKRDHVLRQLGRFGLQGRQLTTRELIELFYNIYHPNVPHGVAKQIDTKSAIL